jgi:serine/threonine protein kinase
MLSRVPARRLFDLKSHNVLLTRDGTAKIADVGLAKVLTQVRALTGRALPVSHPAHRRWLLACFFSFTRCSFHELVYANGLVALQMPSR